MLFDQAVVDSGKKSSLLTLGRTRLRERQEYTVNSKGDDRIKDTVDESQRSIITDD